MGSPGHRTSNSEGVVSCEDVVRSESVSSPFPGTSVSYSGWRFPLLQGTFPPCAQWICHPAPTGIQRLRRPGRDTAHLLMPRPQCSPSNLEATSRRWQAFRSDGDVPTQPGDKQPIIEVRPPIDGADQSPDHSRDRCGVWRSRVGLDSVYSACRIASSSALFEGNTCCISFTWWVSGDSDGDFSPIPAPWAVRIAPQRAAVLIEGVGESWSR